MRSLPIRWSRSSIALLLVSGASTAFSCSSSYEPEGQFWPSLGPVGVDPSSTSAGDDAGMNEQPAGGAVGVRADGVTADGVTAGGVRANGATANGATGGMSSSLGTGGMTAGASSASGGAASATCSLSVSVTTTAPGGRYRPRNVGAIWIADASGRFVKSLDVWGNRRLSNVRAWNAATRAAGVAGNKVDAVTSATLSAHRAHNVSWNCRDYRGQVAPDDTYRVYFEVTDASSAGPNHFESFTKGLQDASVQGSAPSFNGIVLTFKP